MVRRGRRAAGFTLIELTLAIVLLAFGLLTVAGVLARSVRRMDEARLLHRSIRRAESVADSLATVGQRGTGSRSEGILTVAWRRQACAAGACVRVVVRAGGLPDDSVAIVARVAERPEPAP